MNTGGFGFSFGPSDDDGKDEENNKDKGSSRGPGGQGPGDPFQFFFGNQGGAGGFESLFGGLFGAPGGPSQPEEDDGTYIDGEAVKRQLQQLIKGRRGGAGAPASKDAAAVAEATRLAELWLDEVTDIPTAGATGTAWSVEDYALKTLPFWLRLAEPARKATGDTPVVGLGGAQEGAPDVFAALNQFMKRQNRAVEAQRMSAALLQLSEAVISGTDLGLPAAPTSTCAIVTRTFRDDISSLDVPDQEALVYVCAREAARQRLFRHAPWIAESMMASVEEWAAGAYVDTSRADNFMRDNFSGGMENIAEALQKMQSIDPEELAPRLVSSNEHAAPRLQTLIALVEGWVDVVVTAAVSDRLPHAPQLRQAWQRRRSSGGTAATALEAVTGCTIGTPPTPEAITLWERVTTAVGADRRDGCWVHPDLVPSPEQVTNPASFIDRLLDDSLDADFDPIAEIEKLEQELGKSGKVDPESRENPTDEDPSDGKDKS